MFYCLGCHPNCKKFQKFLLEEFARMFSMYTQMGKKENEENQKLVCALERIDELQYEVDQLQDQLNEYQFSEFDM